MLPDDWRRPGEPLQIGLVRTHGDGESFETGPYAVLPWHLEPGRALIDTGHWE